MNVIPFCIYHIFLDCLVTFPVYLHDFSILFLQIFQRVRRSCPCEANCPCEYNSVQDICSQCQNLKCEMVGNAAMCIVHYGDDPPTR